MTALLTLLVALFLPTKAYSQTYFFLSDPEGKDEALKGLRDRGRLILTDPPLRLDFPPGQINTHFVIGGDVVGTVGDRSFAMLEALLDLRRRYPQRMTIILGNKELALVKVMRKLHQEGAFADETKINSELVRKLKIWTEQNRLPDYFRKFQVEKGTGRPPEKVLRDFVRFFHPKNNAGLSGYIAEGRNLALLGNLFVAHQTPSPENLLYTPRSGDRTSVQHQSLRLRMLADSRYMASQSDLIRQGDFDRVNLDFFDSVYSPILGASAPNPTSPAYGPRWRDAAHNDHNPPIEVNATLKHQGATVAFYGHNATQDLPHIVMDTVNNLPQIKGDLSYASDQRNYTVEYDADTQQVVYGRYPDELTRYQVGEKTYLGQLADGRLITNRVERDGVRYYRLYRSDENYSIESRWVTEDELIKMKITSPAYGGSADIDNYNALLTNYLNQKMPGRALRKYENLPASVRAKAPILILGPGVSKNQNADHARYELEIEALLSKRDPNEHVIVTSGIERADISAPLTYEGMVMQKARERGFTIVAMVPDSFIPDQLADVDYLLRKGNNWEKVPFDDVFRHSDKPGEFLSAGGDVFVKRAAEKFRGLRLSQRPKIYVREGQEFGDINIITKSFDNSSSLEALLSGHTKSITERDSTIRACKQKIMLSTINAK